MSNARNAGCVTCRDRNKKCDKSRGSNGCRRCTRAGIICGGYLGTTLSIPKTKHSSRGDEPPTSTIRGSEHINPNEFPSSSISPPVPKSTLRSEKNTSLASGADNQDCNPDSFDWRSNFPISPPYDPHSRVVTPHEQPRTPAFGQIPSQAVQLLTPPDENRVYSSPPYGHPGRSVSSRQANSLDSLFGLVDDPSVAPYIPGGSGRSLVRDSRVWEKQTSEIQAGPSCGTRPRTEPTEDHPENLDDIDGDGVDNILVRVLVGLTLDRAVESNSVPFVAHSFASWIYYFDFEPAHAIGPARDIIARGFAVGGEVQQRMILIANTVSAVTSTTDYQLTYFMTLYQQFAKVVMEARACSDISREAAMKAIASCHVMIPVASRIASLATVLNLLDMYGPIFRRACPESVDQFVNLPRRLIAPDPSLKYYASFDVLQSVITHRPMFFRYDLEILSPETEKLLDVDGGSGLKLSIGVPDRLVLILAKINTLLEDCGKSVDQETVRGLEKEIAAIRKPVVPLSSGDSPSLMIGRLMVQESWRLAAYVYLYMGLCRADSRDARVLRVQKQFMRLLGTLKPSRNPDSFLILPMVIVGIATSSPEDQTTLFARLWGVSECRKPGTLGNDVTRMLNDIWERTSERPAVWSDLRVACLRIIGM